MDGAHKSAPRLLPAGAISLPLSGISLTAARDEAGAGKVRRNTDVAPGTVLADWAVGPRGPSSRQSPARRHNDLSSITATSHHDTRATTCDRALYLREDERGIDSALGARRELLHRFPGDLRSHAIRHRILCPPGSHLPNWLGTAQRSRALGNTDTNQLRILDTAGQVYAEHTRRLQRHHLQGDPGPQLRKYLDSSEHAGLVESSGQQQLQHKR